MKKKIEVRHGNEYCTKISEIYDESDFFYEAYTKAAQGVRDIVEATEKFHSRHHTEERARPKRGDPEWAAGITERMYLARHPNNFIAFCAGRGQGKTSAMVSFSTALGRLSEETGREAFWGESITKSDFYVLDPIDPTMMNQGDSILRIVISRMFECYDREEKRRRNWNSFSSEKEPELLNEFRQCYRSLDVLQKGRDLQDCYDDLEYLADLGDSSHLKETFRRLASLFLNLIFQKKDGDSQQFLVIQIDDADLNASNAYHIVEELRKYCVVPNVIILMATDFEQLELTVEKHFIEELEILCKFKTGDGTVQGHCHKMMERYLDKLIPGTRQVHLPLIDHYIKDYENELELSYHDKRLKPYSGDYQDILLQMIYEKTGLMLMKPSGYLHNLLPKTMRELTHMLAYLSDLEDIKFENGALSKLIQAWRRTPSKVGESTVEPGLTAENLAALDLRRKNIDAFMLYLRHCWAKAALTEEQQAVVVPAMETTIDMKIRRLLSDLKAYGAKRYDIWDKQDEEHKEEDNGRTGTQYVDVIETLDMLKAMPDCTEEFCLIYISATILTLYMHLLAMQDLEEGLEFKRLKEFVGDDIFPSEIGVYCKGDLRYDCFDIDYDFVPKLVGGGDLALSNPDTRTVAQLLLTMRKTDDDASGIVFGEDILGSQAALFKIFRNCLDRTTCSSEAPITTEILDVILSWDLQYHIRKELTSDNAADKKKKWLPYEIWLVKQLRLIDEVYKKALEALKIETTSAALETVFSNARSLLAALAIGNPVYAKKWWQAVKAELDRNWENIEAILSRAVKALEGDGEDDPDSETHRDVAAALTKLLAPDSGSGSNLVATEEFLSEGAIYRGGTTPRDVINRVSEILPNTMELDEDKLLALLQSESGKIDDILSVITTCRADLAEIKLYCQTDNETAEDAEEPKGYAEKTKASERQKSPRVRRRPTRQKNLKRPRTRMNRKR